MKYGYGGYEKEYDTDINKLIDNYIEFNNIIIITYLDGSTQFRPLTIENLNQIEKEMLDQITTRRDSEIFSLAKKRSKQYFICTLIFSFNNLISLIATFINIREKNTNTTIIQILIDLICLNYLKSNLNQFVYYKKLVDELKKYDIYLDLKQYYETENKQLSIDINDVDNISTKDLKKLQKMIKFNNKSEIK